MENNLEQATFGGGCFWCTEAVFKRVKGVYNIKPGYEGGNVENPTYEQVCNGNTGHAEVIIFDFDPTIVTYEVLLDIFFATHDPTTLNRQGNDAGTQYRSIIFYHSETQQTVALQKIAELNASGVYSKEIVTKVEPHTTFYEAEAYHHNYFENNPTAGYCTVIINPKIEKFEKRFADLLK